MGKLKKWAATLSSVVILVSAFTFVTPAPKASALTYKCPSDGYGNGLLQPGETCEYTPEVSVLPDDDIPFFVKNTGRQTVHWRFVRVWDKKIVHPGGYVYPNYTVRGTLDLNTFGNVRLELRCTSGATITNNCNAEGWFDAW
ncbi:hypothetical protein WAZ07_16795 [Bacillus sp. FJAT-51639]|uniref:Uncharacterized protein n=1 Tax=Bacillus bruguierae TaxID=3127667 RepID=A0ABU8FK92_9BACI